LRNLLFPGLTPARLLSISAVLVAVAVFLVSSPLSPFALWYADAQLGAGQADVAAAHYDAIARSNPSLAPTALRRSAQVWAVELRQPAGARRRMERLLAVGDAGLDRARLEARIGTLLLREGRPRAAGRHFLAAFDEAPDSKAAHRRLLAAAEAIDESGDREDALATWERLARAFPQHAPRAAIARGDLALAQGHTERALAMYEVAAAHGDGDLAAIGRLGSATCLERLGSLDEAIAELDAAELPSGVADSRIDGMRARAARR